MKSRSPTRRWMALLGQRRPPLVRHVSRRSPTRRWMALLVQEGVVQSRLRASRSPTRRWMALLGATRRGMYQTNNVAVLPEGGWLS